MSPSETGQQNQDCSLIKNKNIKPLKFTICFHLLKGLTQFTHNLILPSSKLRSYKITKRGSNINDDKYRITITNLQLQILRYHE